jgi:hypothetical protein
MTGTCLLVASIVLISWQLLLPRDLYTGTNSVGVRNVVASLSRGQELCVPDVAIPEGTGRVRFAVFGRDHPRLTAVLSNQNRRTVGRALGGQSARRDRVDIPLPPMSGDSSQRQSTVCLRASGPIQIGGMSGLQTNDVSPTVEGRPIRNRVALWFLPPKGTKKALLAEAGVILERASLFRPSVIGPWFYVILLVCLVPALLYSAVRVLAKVLDGWAASVRRVAVIVFVLAVANAWCWSVITPMFNTPDETEHFAYVQYLAETGRVPERAPGTRPVWSSREGIAIEGLRALSNIEMSDARPPWTSAAERQWRAKDAKRPPQGNGGGYNTPATHPPPYYLALAPAYLATRRWSPWSQVTAERLVSGLFGGLTACLVLLTVAELIPRWRAAALVAALVVAFEPMVGFMFGAINNDAGVNATAALLIYLTIRGLRRGMSVPLAIAIGAVAALLPLMKLTGFALYPAAATGVIGGAIRAARSSDRREGWSRGLRVLAAAGGTLLACAAAWKIVAPLLGRGQTAAPTATVAPQESVASSFLAAPGSYASYVWQVFFPRLPFMADRHLQAWPAFDIYVERAWAAFGWYAVFFPIWVYVVIGVMMATTGLLAARTLIGIRESLVSYGWEVAVLGLALVGVIIGVEIAYQSPTPRPVIAEQGRYAFTALVPLGVIVGAACLSVRGACRNVLATVLVCSVLSLSFASQLLVITSFYA